jgi:hypothetical protein
MKIIFTVTVLLTLCLVAFAQPVVVSSNSGKFQSVGGDFGRTWISDFQAQNPKPATQENNNNSLWGWGTIPKGKMLVGGKLIDAPNTTYTYNTSGNWLGDYYIDPYTGRPIYDSYPGYLIPIYSNSAYSNNSQYLQLPVVLQSPSTNPWII